MKIHLDIEGKNINNDFEANEFESKANLRIVENQLKLKKREQTR